MGSTRRYRAEWVVPVAGTPIRGGEVVVRHDIIVDVRRSSGGLDRGDRDLGEAIILPGLVNVHTHLDYTVMRGLVEDLSFFPWVRTLTGRARALTDDDWLTSALVGAVEAVCGGVTTVADCTFSGAALSAAKQVGLRGIVYQEFFGVEATTPVADSIDYLRWRVGRLRDQAADSRLVVGISPHSLYTVRPELFRAGIEYARADALPVCTHAAESQAECDLVRHGTGAIADAIRAREVSWNTPGGTALAFLDSLGALGPGSLLAHGIQLSTQDAAIIRRTGAAWAHCPKSNAKLANGIAPLRLLLAMYPDGEARVGIGSDSVASNNGMDLFEEMRFAVLVQRAHTRDTNAVDAHRVLHMATIDGARALGLDGLIGSLEPGKQADLCAVRADGPGMVPATDPVAALVYSASSRDVALTVIGGDEVWLGGTVAGVDWPDLRARATEISGRLGEAAESRGSASDAR